MKVEETQNLQLAERDDCCLFQVPFNCFDITVCWDAPNQLWLATDNGMAAATWLTAYDQWPITMTKVITDFGVRCAEDEFFASDNYCRKRAAYRLIAALLRVQDGLPGVSGKFLKGTTMSDILKKQQGECLVQLDLLHRLCRENCDFLEKMAGIHSAAARELLSNGAAGADQTDPKRPAEWLTSGSQSVMRYWQEGLNCSLQYQRQFLSALAKK